jgi:hypothetical protein
MMRAKGGQVADVSVPRAAIAASFALGLAGAGAGAGCGNRYVIGTLPESTGDAASADAAIDVEPPPPFFCRDAADCDAAPPNPCAGLACGAVCTVCPASDRDCVKLQAFDQCNKDGVCSSDPPQCATTPYTPCSGKRCGDACHPCDPADTGCFEPAVQQYCDSSGECRADNPLCAQ